MSSLHPSVRDTTRVALEISGLLSQAESAQWQRSRIVLPDSELTDSAIRSQGEHSDPTFDAASDPARLALREAVQTAEQSLRLYLAVMTQAGVRLQAALDRWNGGI